MYIKVNTALKQSIREYANAMYQKKFSYPEFVDDLFKKFPDIESTLHHAGTGICSEAGEIIDITKGPWAHEKPIDDARIAHLIEELGDLRFYYQATLNILGLTDEDVQASNVKKLSARYPDGVYTNVHAQLRLDKND